MQNNIRTTEKVIQGIKMAIDLIKPTYGNYGTNVLIATDEYPFNKISNDAYTIIKAIESKNKDEKQGLNLIKELMDRQNSISGDGRKTTAILASKLIDLSLEDKLPKIELKKLLDNKISEIENKLKDYIIPIDIKDIEKVAKVSTESDELAKLLQEIFNLVGKDGVIEIESSGTTDTYFDFIEGNRFHQLGYLSNVFVNDEDARREGRQELKAIYENPVILVTKQKISSSTQVNPLLTSLVQKGIKNLVILANEIDSTVTTNLIQTHKSLPELNILILKPPVMWKDGIFEDFAKSVGATIIDPNEGLSLSELDFNYLGTCDKIITTKEDTTILGIKDIKSHIENLKKDLDNESQLRANWLSSKTIILKIGGNSEQDIFYKRMKCQDGVNSCKSALEHGVVLGSGITFKKVSDSFTNEGIDGIIKKTLLEPYNQLCINAKRDITEEEIKDIYDSAYIVKQSIRNAIGLASSICTLGGALPMLAKTPEELALLRPRQF